MAYCYTLDLLADDGRPLEQAAVVPDWSHALAWTHFEGVRRGELPAVRRMAAGTVEPVWDGRLGEPWVASFRATVRNADGRTASREIPKLYLRDVAEDLSRELVRSGRLAVGATYRWMVAAFPAPAAPSPDGDQFAVESVEQPLPIAAASLAPLSERAAVAAGGDGTAASALPVFVPEHVLEDALVSARGAGDVETGGVLLGRLCRDTGAAGDLFVEVTAQVPAKHTVATATRLTFTSETWAAAHAALALRGGREELVGWWHLHIDFCRVRGCPPERRRVCPATDPFLSAEDVHLHASCFPAGHQVALLLSESTAAGVTPSLFGWVEGRVSRRPFHRLREAADPTTKGTDDAAISPAP